MSTAFQIKLKVEFLIMAATILCFLPYHEPVNTCRNQATSAADYSCLILLKQSCYTYSHLLGCGKSNLSNYGGLMKKTNRHVSDVY